MRITRQNFDPSHTVIVDNLELDIIELYTVGFSTDAYIVFTTIIQLDTKLYKLVYSNIPKYITNKYLDYYTNTQKLTTEPQVFTEEIEYSVLNLFSTFVKEMYKNTIVEDMLYEVVHPDGINMLVIKHPLSELSNFGFAKKKEAAHAK